MKTLVTGEASCPRCGAEEWLPILHGRLRLEDRPAREARYPDGYLTGGCVISGVLANRGCRGCGTRYRFEPEQAARLRPPSTYLR